MERKGLFGTSARWVGHVVRSVIKVRYVCTRARRATLRADTRHEKAGDGPAAERPVISAYSNSAQQVSMDTSTRILWTCRHAYGFTVCLYR